MHELSVVQNILEIAGSEMKKAKANKVDQIDLDIGVLSGIEIDAFLFAWDTCLSDTILATTKRNINRIPAKAKCTSCSHIFETEDYFAQCPDCAEYLTTIIQGKELKVRSLSVS